MNTLIWVFFALITIYMILGFLLPKETIITAKLKMSGSSKTIFNTISNFTNWKEWEVWNKEDLFKSVLSNERNKIGARYRLKSNAKEVKDSLIVFKEKKEHDFLKYDWYYGKRKRGEITFTIQEKANFTIVTSQIFIYNGNKIFGRYFTLWNKQKIKALMDDVLLKIDATGI